MFINWGVSSQSWRSSPALAEYDYQPALTVTDHVGVQDELMEEGQHLDHLVLRLCLGQLACPERLRDVGLEEARVDGVHDLHKSQRVQLTLKRYLRLIGFSALLSGR